MSTKEKEYLKKYNAKGCVVLGLVCIVNYDELTNTWFATSIRGDRLIAEANDRLFNDIVTLY